MPLTRREREIGKAMRKGNVIWLVMLCMGENDPTPDILGAWLIKELAEQEQLRVQKEITPGFTIEIYEYPLNTPWKRGDRRE
jgi:hypothetical protein